MKKVLIFLSVFVLIFIVLSTVNIYAYNPIPDDELDNPSYDTYCLEDGWEYGDFTHDFIHKLTNCIMGAVELCLGVFGISLEGLFSANFVLFELIICLFVLIIFLNIFKIIIWSIIDFIDNKKITINEESNDILRCKYNKVLMVFQILSIIIIIFFLIICIIPIYYFPDYCKYTSYFTTY